MDNVRIHPILKEIAELFSAAGKKVYLVGGAVRDILRSCEPEDWDLATDATPETVSTLFRHVVPTGIKHGTVTVIYKGHMLETTTFRTETGYSDGRRPDEISYAATIEEDLSRRDFTMNAIAVELPGGHLVDPFDGQGDINRRLIRCVGAPSERFGEDGLRPLRAARFAAQLGYQLDRAAEIAIPKALDKTALVAPERVRDELEKMLRAPYPSIGFLVMEKTGLLALLLPELARCRGVEQKGHHRFDVLDHSLKACDAVSSDQTLVRLAALFHDLGKPQTMAVNDEGNRTFYGHEEVSARLAEEICHRFRYPNATIDFVVHLIRNHMFHYEESWTDAAVRRFVVRIGESNLADAYALRRADMYATEGFGVAADALAPLSNRVRDVLAKTKVLSIKDLAVDGRDLSQSGIATGPRMGIILRELLETVLTDPEMNERTRLIELAVRLDKRFRG